MSKVSLPLLAAAAVALAGCELYDRAAYGSRPGVTEYPGSGAPSDSPTIYVVQRGDTVDSLASRFGVSRQSIIERNTLSPPYDLRQGAWIEVPGARVAAGPGPSVPSASATLPPRGGAPRPGEVRGEPLPAPGAPPPSAGASLPPPRETTPAGGPQPVPLPGAGRAPQPEAVAASPAPSALPAGRFDWPVRGRIISGYGPRSGGERNDGIDIGAPLGTPVKAAADGQVVYAGAEVRGLGNLVLISHPGGAITAYAHCAELSVAKGASVKKGQQIAKVGQTGDAREPMLHFEIRQRNRPVDPAPLLPP